MCRCISKSGNKNKNLTIEPTTYHPTNYNNHMSQNSNSLIMNNTSSYILAKAVVILQQKMEAFMTRMLFDTCGWFSHTKHCSIIIISR